MLGDVDGCAVLVAAGEIDLWTSPGLREALADALHRSDRVIVDLARVRFLDSTGMTVMVEAMNQTHHRDKGALCLVGPAGVVARALEVTGLTRMFPIHSSLEEAARALA